MFQLAGGVGLRVDIADLFQLQGTLQAHGVVQVPADEEDGVVVEVPGGVILDVLRVGEELAHLLRQQLHLGENGVILALFHRTQQVRQIEAHQIHQHQLGGVCLGGGHGDLRPGPSVQHVIRLSGDGAAHHIDDGQGPAAPALGLPHGGHSVQGFSRLADDDDQSLFVHQRITVPELGGQHHLHRAAQQLFPAVLAHYAHMVAGAAGDDVNPGEVADVLRRQMQIVQHHTAVPDAGGDGLADRLRLLHDLLGHEVGVAALLRCGHIPVHQTVGLLHRQQLVVKHVHAVGGEDSDLPIVHVHHVPGVLDDSRHVGGDEVAVLTVADDEGAVLPGGNEGVGVIRTDDAEGVGPLDPPQAAAHSLQHVVAFVVVELQQLCHHLRVRVGGEVDALAHEVLLDFQIVFDDAVVDEGDPPVLADVGMGVDVIWLPVGGPAGMPDAQVPLQVRAAVDQVG